MEIWKGGRVKSNRNVWKALGMFSLFTQITIKQA